MAASKERRVRGPGFHASSADDPGDFGQVTSLDWPQFPHWETQDDSDTLVTPCCAKA